jgi:protein-L-isoaspartate(D-aspartate) O-methyltransferase
MGLELGQENFAAMRKAMVVSQLRTSGIQGHGLLAAFDAVAREDFVPVPHRLTAYADRNIVLGGSREMLAPLSVGWLLDAAQVSGEDRLLVIGAATGYLAALAAQLAGSVTALEQDKGLVQQAARNLAGYANVQVVNGALSDGHTANAPYSVIIIEGATETIPDTVIAQLAEGGRIAAGVSERGVTRIGLGYKAAKGVGFQYVHDCEMPVLPGFAVKPGFVF